MYIHLVKTFLNFYLKSSSNYHVGAANITFQTVIFEFIHQNLWLRSNSLLISHLNDLASPFTNGLVAT